ncbi:MAG TPA: hypothetical protein V6D47_06990, partial [Oscillatoriaceae cyanobacterium]
MESRSIRSFALDYYRQQGHAVRPLAESDAYEVLPAEGPALTVTFTGDAEQPELQPLTATSPQWRAIIEDLTGKLAVSYRYLTSGPIANPAKALEAALPKGWQVKAAKLLHVDSRPAVGFTHRVTFDSPALSACREVIHHHVWDTRTGDRLTGLEPVLYELPCILLRPNQLPEEETLKQLLERSAALVDGDTDVRGHELERELAELLADVERRTNQYYEQQMGNVLNREIQLTEKLDALIKRLSEARQPEQIARYRQEGESLQLQLGNLKHRREGDLQEIEQACLRKLTQERERHELTAMVDLVALCHATYDVLTYRATLVSPEGHDFVWNLTYWPVTKALALPECPGCHAPMRDPVILGEGAAACRDCLTACACCGTARIATGDEASCAICQCSTCERCASQCAHCGETICVEHTGGCRTCEAPVCGGCSRACAECAEPLCEHHAHRDPVNGKTYCADHRRVLAELPEPEPAPEAPVAVASAPVTEPSGRVVSRLSGRELDARAAEYCHGCHAHFEVREMVNCQTCGVPCCLPCSTGEEGPCPSCERLQDTSADDARLDFVRESYPELARGKRKWAIAEFGPYVVVHWSRLGTWGMVTYTTEELAPIVTNAFACG